MSDCKHDFDKPEAKTHTVNCKLCGEEFFIDDYYFWVSAREKEQLQKENQNLRAKLGAIGALMKDGRYEEATALLPPNCEQVVREVQAEAVQAAINHLVPINGVWDAGIAPYMLSIRKNIIEYARQLRNPEQEKA